MAAARLAVFPTRQNLQVMKVKLTGAKKGHSLLKKKADALSMRLRALLKNIIEAKDNVGLAFREGNFALAEVKYAAGDIKPMVIESVGTAQVRAPLCVDAKYMPARLACVALLFPPALPLPCAVS
jgi:V-type H+-transporting ATPase subunit D